MFTETQADVQVEAYVSGEAITQVPALTAAHYQQWLQTWIRALDPQRSPINTYEVTLRLTTDADIQQLNTDYRQQAKPTDVLSFAALETNLPGAAKMYQSEPLPLGDIIISVETAARQAINAQHSLSQELAWLAAHGLLHLLGWDHPNDASLSQMLAKQDSLLTLVDC